MYHAYRYVIVIYNNVKRSEERSELLFTTHLSGLIQMVDFVWKNSLRWVIKKL